MRTLEGVGVLIHADEELGAVVRMPDERQVIGVRAGWAERNEGI